MIKNKSQMLMNMYKEKFFLSDNKINAIHQNFILKFKKALAKSNKTPIAFINEIINFMLMEQFDANFIRAVFGKESKVQSIYKDEIEEFKNIFLTKMIKK